MGTERTASLFSRAFTLDLRAIALFRIALGLVVSTDLYMRSLDAGRHYSDAGMLPRSALSYPLTLSLHLLDGSPGFQSALFVAGMILAAGLTLGAWPRLCAALLFAFSVSMQNRNETILEGYDLYSRTLLLWASFLPLGARLAVFGGTPPASRHVASLGTAVMLCQIFVVYFYNGLNKLNETWTSGEAIFNALSYLYFPTAFGEWLRGFPDAMRFFTQATLGIELLAPLLLICPYLPGLCKGLFFLTFVALHVGIWASLDVGLFPAVSLAALLMLIPSTLGAPPEGRERIELPMWQNAVVGALVAVHLLFHLGPRLPGYRGSELSQQVAFVTASLRLAQRWTMFHTVPRTTFWPLVLGRTADGRTLRLPDHKELTVLNRRASLQVGFTRHRQKKEFLALDRAGPLYDTLRERYLESFCQRSPARLLQVDFYVVRLPEAYWRGIGPADVKRSVQCSSLLSQSSP